MSTQKVSHQGTLRGSYEIPMEPTTASDGETMGYKTAVSDAGSDDSSNANDSRQKSTDQGPSGLNDGIEVEELPDDYPESQQGQQQNETPRRKTPKDSPAYVAPIGSVKVPPIEPISFPTPPPEDNSETPRKTPVHQIPKDHLVGKKIDDFGDIVGENGNVLGRVEGDLPSMVGRTISNARGDVLGDDGGLLGYVAEVATGEGQQKQSKQQHPTWDLADVMKAMADQGEGPGGLRVDPFGNILDGEGNVVGSFHDNRTGFGRKKTPGSGNGDDGGSKARSSSQPKETPRENKSDEQAGAPASQSEPPRNAQSFRNQPEERKENPSDIFMDVKSTTEGIQLTIRIPTVFNTGGQQAQPKVVFS
ncbi:hypothetical protein VSDG_00658 [Cytospora chrysosperma]|uniref:Uncharacterized protein n=1 Tax=Cytospora chrysosperma TaxID=252740 RepID=A0A423WNV7_CYTCH|nr:hypothetical protein VSDG_00658 [Valsa sordida]